jgi:hypothetical protein
MRCRNTLMQSVPIFTLLYIFTAAPFARADLSLGFQNGLAGWNYPDNPGVNTQGDLGTVTALNGQATIAESTFASETDLTLTFTIPTGAQTLQFTIVSTFADSPPTSGVTPDTFTAALVDPTSSSSLVPTAFPSDDPF